MSNITKSISLRSARGSHGQFNPHVTARNFGNGVNLSLDITAPRGTVFKIEHISGGSGGDVLTGGHVDRAMNGGNGGDGIVLLRNDSRCIVLGGGGGGGGRYNNANEGKGGNAGLLTFTSGSEHVEGTNGTNGYGSPPGYGGERGRTRQRGNAGASRGDSPNPPSTTEATGGGLTFEGGNGGFCGDGGGRSRYSGGGGGGGGFYGGGGGGFRYDKDDSKESAGGGGGGASFLNSTGVTIRNASQTWNTTETTVSATIDSVSIGDNGIFIFSTPTTFSLLSSFSFTKDQLNETINLRDEGVFTEDIDKTYTYFYRVRGVGSYVESSNALELSNNTSLFITTDDDITIARTASAVETFEIEVYTEATVTGITETSNTFTITLEFTNNPPTVNAITQSVHWNSTDNTFDFDGNDADIGDSLNYSISTTANGLYGASISDTNNSVTVDGSQFIVDSSNNSTFTFFYIANDGFNDSTPAQIRINKTNERPTVNGVTYTMHWNSSKTFDFSGNDENSDSLTYRIASSSGGSFSGGPLNLTEGTVEIVNTNQFTVDSSNATPLTFYYKAFDGAVVSDVGTITIEKRNTAPTASNIVRFTHTAAVTITLIGSDSDRNSITFHKNGHPTETYGTWDDSGITDREIKYTPNSNYSLGSDTYGYFVSDSVGSNNYTITVYSGLTNIKDGGQDLTELYKRKHDNISGYINLNKSNYQVNGTDLVNHFERENGTGTSTSNLKVTVGATTYPLDRIFKKR